MEKKKFASIEEVMAAWKKFAGEEERRKLPWHLGAAEYHNLLSGEARGERGEFIRSHLASCQHCCNELAGLAMVAERRVEPIILRRRPVLAASGSDKEGETGEKIFRYETPERDFLIELEPEPEKGEAHLQLQVLNPVQKEKLNGKLVIIRKPDGSDVGVARVRNGIAFLEIQLREVEDALQSLIIVPSETEGREQ